MGHVLPAARLFAVVGDHFGASDLDLVRLEVEVIKEVWKTVKPPSLTTHKAHRILMNQVRSFPAFKEISERDISIEWVKDFT